MKNKKWIIPVLVGVAAVAAVSCMICDDIWARRLIEDEFDDDSDNDGLTDWDDYDLDE